MVVSALNTFARLGGRVRQAAETLNLRTAGQKYQHYSDLYDFWARYYSGEVYERADADTDIIKAWEGLPRHIRPIALYAKRAVDWWPGHVYSGAWTQDGLSSSNGRDNLLPYDDDTPPPFRAALQQTFTWAGGARYFYRYVHIGAKLGDAFSEIHVDYAHNKVYPRLIHPSYVVDLDVTSRGDVEMYRLAIPMYDEIAKRSYMWGKMVTPDAITTFYDDEEMGYDGQPATIRNPYGFTPATWTPHIDTGGTRGAPAIQGIHKTLDEYNGLLSSVDDFIMRLVNQSVIVETDDPQGLKTFLTNDGRNNDPTGTDMEVPTSRRSHVHRQRESIDILPSPTGTRVHHLLDDLGLSASDVHIKRLQEELDMTLPELTLSEKLLDMQQVTEPGSLPLMMDVQRKFDQVSGNYDHGVIRQGQMSCAIMGYHLTNGDFGLPSTFSPKQQKFTRFDLDSYAKGRLDWAIEPRDLVHKSFLQLATEAEAIQRLDTAVALRHIGLSDPDIYGTAPDAIPDPRPGILEQVTGAQTAATVAAF